MSNRKNFRYEIIWEKTQGTGFLNSHKMPLKIHENILVFYSALPTYNPQKSTGAKPYRASHKHQSSNYKRQSSALTINTDGTRYPVDVIRFAACNNTKDKPVHPTQKPVPLLEWLINTYTDPGQTVLDNCMGAGSTGVACVNTGRHFIGIELETKYFEIAQRRIWEAENEAYTLQQYRDSL